MNSYHCTACLLSHPSSYRDATMMVNGTAYCTHHGRYSARHPQLSPVGVEKEAAQTKLRDLLSTPESRYDSPEASTPQKEAG